MTSGLCIRKQIDRDHPDWLEDVVTAIMGVKTITQTVKEIDPDGRETRRVLQDMLAGRYQDHMCSRWHRLFFRWLLTVHLSDGSLFQNRQALCSSFFLFLTEFCTT